MLFRSALRATAELDERVPYRKRPVVQRQCLGKVFDSKLSGVRRCNRVVKSRGERWMCDDCRGRA